MKIMKTALLTMSSLVVSTTVFAATSGTLLLQGTVNEVMSIVVSANGTNNTTLNITAGETNKKVGSAAETSNRLTGYVIKMSSQNGGELRHTADANKKTTYKISYDGGTAVTPSTTPAVVKTVTSLAGLTTNTSDINATVVALPNAVAGTYQDTLTLSIEAN